MSLGQIAAARHDINMWKEVYSIVVPVIDELLDVGDDDKKAKDKQDEPKPEAERESETWYVLSQPLI